MNRHCLIFAFFMSTIISPLRCWIGVIDQINPPWVNVVGERGEELHIGLDQVYTQAKAGDWVIYWTHQRVLESLDTPASRIETNAQDQLMKSLFELP
jgi:hypothetical protein